MKSKFDISDFVSVKYVLMILALVVIHVVSAELGLLLSHPDVPITLIWPPSGIALAAILLLGYRAWPGIFIGDFIVAIIEGHPPFMWVMGPLGNTLAAVAAAWGLQRWVDFDIGLRRVKDIVWLVLIGGILGTLIGATLGAGTLTVVEVIDPHQFLLAWSMWWLGDTVGVTVFAPTLLVFGLLIKERWRPSVIRRRRYLAIGAAFLLLVEINYLVFGGTSTKSAQLVLTFGVFALLILLSTEFGIYGASPAVLATSLIAVIGTVLSYGPFTDPGMSFQEQLATLWFFVAIIAFTMLALGAIVTEKQQVNRALEDSNARFRAIFEQAAVGVALLSTRTGEFIRVNQRFAEILGYSPEELKSMTYKGITHADDLQRDEDNRGSILRGEIRDLNITKRYLHRDGSVVWVNLHGSTLEREGQEVEQHFTIIEDITDRIRAEESLRKGEEKYKSLIHNIAGMVYVGFPDWSAEIIKGCESLSGYSADEVMAMEQNWLSLIYEDDLERVYQEGSELASQENNIVQMYRIISKYGDIRWIEDRKSSRFSDDGEFMGIDGILFDITERVQADHELQQRAEQLELLRQASLRLTSNLDLSSVLEAILEQAMQLVTAKDAHIYLYEQEKLHFGAARWADGRRSVQFAEPRPNGLTYTVARSGECLAVSDMNDHPIFDGLVWKGAITGLPLKIGDQVVGVMNVALDQPYDFTEDELRILELLADQAAIAIDNARLHEQVQDHAQNLENHVEERTAELNKTVNLMAGREVRMAELKKVIKKLRKQLEDAGIPPVANDPLEEPIL